MELAAEARLADGSYQAEELRLAGVAWCIRPMAADDRQFLMDAGIERLERMSTAARVYA